MQEEWIDIREKKPLPWHTTLSVQIQVPCYFDCANDGTALRVFVPDRFVSDNCGYLFPFPIDLTNKKRKWKWKLNENDENHYENLYAWAIKHQNLNFPDNYRYYRRKKNEFKTFRQELPMNGTSIILQFETKGHIYIKDDGYRFMENEKLFMCAEMEVPLKIHLEQEDFILKWKDNY